MHRQHFDNANNWSSAVAEQIVALLQGDIDARGKTTLAIPGGSTANLILPVLAKQKLNWNLVTITLVDERWVDGEHPDSNERLARELLSETLDHATFVGLKTDDITPEMGLHDATLRLEAILPFGCVLLGMGDDGHVASLFPGSDIQSTVLQAAKHDDHPRISMTPATLTQARGIILAVSGEKKCAVIDQALLPGPEADLPIRYVLRNGHAPVSILTV